MHGGDTYEALGRRLRELRGERTQPAVARMLGATVPVVSKAESGRELSRPTAAAYDRAFGTGGEIAAWRERAEAARGRGGAACCHGELAALAQAGGGLVVVMPAPGAPGPVGPVTWLPGGDSVAVHGGPYQAIAGAGNAEGLDMFHRRDFVLGGMAVPVVAGIETNRQGLLRSLVGDGWVTAEEFGAIVDEHYAAYYVTPPAEAFSRLSADLDALDGALNREHSETGQAELRKAGALLVGLMAEAVANLGDLPTARRWARAARKAADTSGDTHTRLWVRGREVVMGLYQRRPVAELLGLAEEAVAIGRAQGPPATFAWPELAAGHAQVLAAAGRAADAEAGLEQVRDAFDTVPDRGNPTSRLGFSEGNLLYTEAYVYSQLGDCRRAEASLNAAREVYRYLPEVDLMQALCLARSGDAAAGITHARTAISGLPPAHRHRTVVDLGQKVLAAAPEAARRTDDAVELRELVAAPV